MSRLGEANIGGRLVPAWLLDTPANDLDALVDRVARISNPNLLDNWYFVDPINQRGEPAYSGNNIMSFDRWKIYNATVTKSDKGITFAKGSTTDWGHFIELIDIPFSAIAGKTFTVSGLVGGQIYSGTATIPTTKPSVFTSFKAVTIAANVLSLAFGWESANDTLFVRFVTRSTGISDTITAAKLELGSTQTLAHLENGNWVLNDPPPNKALELAKCQRYFYEVNQNGVLYPYLGTAVGVDATKAYIVVNLPVPLRAIPSIVFSGTWRILSGNVAIPIVSISAVNSNTIGNNGVIVLILNTDGGLTQGTAYTVSGEGTNVAPKFAFNANL